MDAGLSALQLLTPLQKIKFLQRQGWLQRGLESDTIAAHILDTMYLGKYLAQLEGVSPEHVANLLMYHDLVMGYMEDVTPQGGKYADKRVLEAEAWNKVKAALPADVVPEVEALWEEFQAQISFESQVALEADKLSTLYQGLFYEQTSGKSVLSEFLTTYKDKFKTASGKEMYGFIVSRAIQS